MLVNHSRLTYALMIGARYVIQWFGVIFLLYFVIIAGVAGVAGISSPWSIALECLGGLELFWFLLWYLPYKRRLQRPGLTVVQVTRPQRKALFEMLLSQVPDTELFLTKWFNDAKIEDIHRSDLRDWLFWALWGSDSHVPHDPEEVDEYIDQVEERAGFKLRPGRGGAKPIRLNIDPVRMIHRSLLFYSLIATLDTFTAVMLYATGFKFYRQPLLSYTQVFPPRPLAYLSFRKSPTRHFSYYYRPHKSVRYRPVVFCHGIGIGLPTYLFWLQTLPKDIGVIAIEFLPVSSRICSEAVTAGMFGDAVRAILQQHRINDFVYVGHSYGTLMARPLLDNPVVAPMINSIVLCDPVSIMLHLPDVAYNIARRKASDAPQVQIEWGASLDPRVAHTLTRRLHWPENIIFRENLVGRGMRTTAVVASRDCVLNPDAVASYVYYGKAGKLSTSEVEELKRTQAGWTGRDELELIYFHDQDHGQSFMIPWAAKVISKVVETYSMYDFPPPPGAEAQVGEEEKLQEELKGGDSSKDESAEEIEVPIPPKSPLRRSTFGDSAMV
ncbi:hypothetical protein BX600DRAFT_88130 [Xylariales sp. PMI_506]|nr:hypothetical protein BX600DRAFT_88130 [Xylariales sp. PMI_506]